MKQTIAQKLGSTAQNLSNSLKVVYGPSDLRDDNKPEKTHGRLEGAGSSYTLKEKPDGTRCLIK